jgi:hypothetical protein
MKIRTKNWCEIYSFYKELKETHNWKISPMIELVSSIKNSKYAQGMYGYTSHATLCIGQYPELNDINALLKIEHIPSKNEISFSYKGDNSLKYTWHKSFPEKDICKEFESFNSELKWVV